jgi:23S rRNA pseudouridine1911/1915/1917 synthase
MRQAQNPSPKRKTFDVQLEGSRLDRFLSDACPDLSRSRIQRLIDDGFVTVDGTPERASFRLKKGSNVELVLPPIKETTLVPEDILIDVKYEDRDIAVVDKPAGLTVYPAAGHYSHTLANALIRRFPDLATFGDSLRPGIVHRLDKDTSGLMVIARNEKARTDLIEQFKSRAVVKCYKALVKGRLMPLTGSIDAPIGRDPSDRKRMAVVTGGREARTDYHVLEHLGAYTLVEACIKTGRTHQIRVHFSAIGHPLLGDSAYGGKSQLLGRQFLHAGRLELRLPSNNEIRAFVSALPADLQSVLSELRRLK